VAFGSLEIAGRRYDHDVVIEAGVVRKRRKKPSKIHRERYGHTPLSLAEAIPWGGATLLVGTGVHGALPIMDEVRVEAEKRGIALIAVPTPEACRRLAATPDAGIHAILHATC
jgi:hypothetical protein